MAASDQSNASTTATEVHVIDAWGVIHTNVQGDESDNDDEGDERCGGCTRYNDTDDFDYRSHISTHVPSDDNVSELTEGVATDNLSPDDLSTNDVSTDDDPTDDAATDDVSTYDDGKDEMPHLSYQSGFMSCLFCAKRRRLLWWQQLAMYICIQTVSDWWAMLASRKVWPHQSLKGHIEICIYIYIYT